MRNPGHTSQQQHRPQKGAASGTSGGDTPTCNFCGKKGHKADVCFSKHGYLEGHPRHRQGSPKTLKQQQRSGGRQQSDTGNSKKSINGSDEVFHHGGFHTTVHQSSFKAGPQTRRNDVLYDSGASSHFINDLDLFTGDTTLCDNLVAVGDGRLLHAPQKGTIRLVLQAPDDSQHSIDVSNCLYVPDMQVNLGGERVADKGLYYRSDTKHLFLRGGIIIGHCIVVDGLPHVAQSHKLDAPSARVVRLSDPHTPLPPQTAYINSSKVIYPASATAQDWHLRLSHLSASALKKAVQTHNGIVIEGNIPDKLSCEACQLATAKRKISRIPGKRPTTPYDESSVDTVVPKAAGLGYGSVQYITTVTDGMCLYRHGKSYRTRGGAGVYPMDHTTYIKTQLDIDVKNIRADNDKALTDNGAFHTSCVSHEAINCLHAALSGRQLRPGVKHYDAITAFPNAMVKEHKIYVRQPHRFEQQPQTTKPLVCLLLKALYGLKQSPLLWYQELTKYLKSVHFTPLWSDACFFRHELGILLII